MFVKEIALTRFRMSDISGDMGRIKLFADAARIRFPEGTFANIDDVLREGEDRSDFIREAVDAYIRQRRLNPNAEADAPIADEQLPYVRELLNEALNLYEAQRKRAPKRKK